MDRAVRYVCLLQRVWQRLTCTLPTRSSTTAPVRIPSRTPFPSENYLDCAEQHMGGSPITGRPPFAGSTTPRASLSPSAARQAGVAGAQLQVHGVSARMPVARMSGSPSMPFAFTPQPSSASSLASGLHPLAQQLASPPVSSGGSADAYGRFALALRRSSWSPTSSLAVSLPGALSSSPVLDPMSLNSPPSIVGSANMRRTGFRDGDAGSTGGACSPDDGLDSELDPLPFALEDVFVENLEEATAAAPCSAGTLSARADAAVGALVRLMTDAPPLRAAHGCSLRDALCELELYRAASRF